MHKSILFLTLMLLCSHTHIVKSCQAPHESNARTGQTPVPPAPRTPVRYLQNKPAPSAPRAPRTPIRRLTASTQGTHARRFSWPLDPSQTSESEIVVHDQKALSQAIRQLKKNGKINGDYVEPLINTKWALLLKAAQTLDAQLPANAHVEQYVSIVTQLKEFKAKRHASTASQQAATEPAPAAHTDATDQASVATQSNTTCSRCGQVNNDHLSACSVQVK